MAPEPMTTTRLPASSRSSGQNCGCTSAPCELLEAGDLGVVRLAVAVVARAHEQVVARDRHRLGRPVAGGALGRHGPRGVVARPLGATHGVTEADVPVDAELGDGLAQVVHDRRAVGDRLGRRPRLEPVAERVHVAVGPHARVAEQVPRAADVVAALEDRVAATRDTSSAGGSPHRSPRCPPRPPRRRRARPSARRYRQSPLTVISSRSGSARIASSVNAASRQSLSLKRCVWTSNSSDSRSPVSP